MNKIVSFKEIKKQLPATADELILERLEKNSTILMLDKEQQIIKHQASNKNGHWGEKGFFDRGADKKTT